MRTTHLKTSLLDVVDVISDVTRSWSTPDVSVTKIFHMTLLEIS